MKIQLSTGATAGRSRWPRSELIVVLAGLIVLTASSTHAFRRLSWSDEIVYAVMARNIATNRGIVSNYYDARSLLQSGFPLGDVHMPGHALAMSAVFVALGPSEFTAMVPSAVAFLSTAILLLRMGRRLFSEGVGLTAAILFFLSPPLAGYAHTAMAELLLVLLACAYFAAWCEAMQRPRLSIFGLLALTLCLGTTVRETFLVFLPSAVYSLVAWRSTHRVWGTGLFCLILCVYTAVVLAPLSLARAPYPNFLSDVLAPSHGSTAWEVLARNVAWNLGGPLPCPGTHPSEWVFFLQGMGGVVLPLLLVRQKGALGRASSFTILCWLATFVALVGIYPFRDLRAPSVLGAPTSTWWAGTRAFMFLSGPTTLILAAGLEHVKLWRLRAITLVATAAVLSFVSLQANVALASDRLLAYRFDASFSQMVADVTRRFQPRVVLAETAFLFGWYRFPVNVIWRASGTPEEIAALERVTPLDAILVGEVRRQALEEAVRTGQVRGGYKLELAPVPGVYLFVGRECLERIGRPASPPDK